MSQHKRILKEAQTVLSVLKHARDDDGNKLNVCMCEIYLTDADTGEVLELEIGVDEEGDILKTFGREDTIEVELEDENEEYTGLLN